MACADTPAEHVDFGIGISMFRAEVDQMGNSSHGHNLWGFESTGVTIVPGQGEETLEIAGDITGFGPISTDGITVKLEKKTPATSLFRSRWTKGMCSDLKSAEWSWHQTTCEG